MLRFQVNDKIKVNNNINIEFDDKIEKIFINQKATIIKADEKNIFPYVLKFDNPKIEEINEVIFGYRWFEDYELDKI